MLDLRFIRDHPDEVRANCEARGVRVDLERLSVLAGVREFPIRVKCATLAWHTMSAAMSGNREASTE